VRCDEVMSENLTPKSKMSGSHNLADVFRGSFTTK